MKNKVFLILILLLAIFFRFNNLNWDSNQHLHPDERFLTMVGNSLKIPNNIIDYLNSNKSTLNPANVGYKFFVYGTFPLTLNKLIAVSFGNDNYNSFTIQGRFLSALFDLLTVIVVYKIAKLLFSKITDLALWSAFFYVIAVYPIQASHFFTTDSFQVFFSLMAVYLSTRSKLVLSAIFFGLALASKISTVYVLPLIFIFTALPFLRKKQWLNILVKYIFFVIVVTLTVFFADPKFFTPIFFDNLHQLRALSVKEAWYPPLVQWLSKKPVIFSFQNLAFYGVGLPYFTLVIVGMVWIISKIKNFELLIILIWVILFFLYQSSQLVQSIRYLYILFPFLAIFAAIGITQLFNYILRITNSKLIRNSSFVIMILILLIWPLMFSSIYFHKHTRVEASEWIYQNLKTESLILSEYWDDPLPLGVTNRYGKQFQIEALPVFDPDTKEKWERINQLLGKADYYVLSSNRGWGSITTVPEKYPKMSKFYNDLLAGKLSYKKIKEFKPYYYRFFQPSNSLIEETLTVYDHPTVMVFKKKE